MKTNIFYFSGTGNSLKCAMSLAEKLGGATITAINKAVKQKIDLSADRIGIVFPVYAWGLPLIVADFIKKLMPVKDKYVFAVATCGGSTGSALVQAKKLLAKRGITLNAGFRLKMPANCISLYGAMPTDVQEKILKNADIWIDQIAKDIINRENHIYNEFFLTNIILSGLVYKLFSKNVKKSDKRFWVTEKCDGCGLCAKICPVHNITINNKKPAWHHNCQQCVACIQWCPQEAIQHGKATLARKRYRHPDIKPSMLC